MLPMGAVSVVVLGRPAPQGSKGPGMVEDNPRTRPWRATIKAVCQQHLPAGWKPLDGPLELELWFFFAPAANVKRGDYPTTRTYYDADKLYRAMGDGLTDGGVVVDDARFVSSHVHKRFVWPDEGEPRAVAMVSPCRG